MHIAIVNRSRWVSHTAATRMASAIYVSTNTAFVGAWRLEPISVSVYTGTDEVPPGAYIAALVDTKTQSQAYGWHDVHAGLPVVFDQVDMVREAGGGVLDGGSLGYSVSAALSHEVFEMLADPFCNQWVVFPRGHKYAGRMLAKEVCDPVQSDVWDVKLSGNVIVQVSNAVLPAYFSPNTLFPKGTQFDLAGKVKTSFALRPGGYWVTKRSTTGDTIDVWGPKLDPKIVEWKKQRRRYESRQV